MILTFDCHSPLQRSHSHSLSFLESKKEKIKLQENTKEKPKKILILLLKLWLSPPYNREPRSLYIGTGAHYFQS